MLGKYMNIHRSVWVCGKCHFKQPKGPHFEVPLVKFNCFKFVFLQKDHHIKIHEFFNLAQLSHIKLNRFD